MWSAYDGSPGSQRLGCNWGSESFVPLYKVLLRHFVYGPETPGPDNNIFYWRRLSFEYQRFVC